MDTLIRQLADKDAIRDLVYRYCRAVDRLDIELGHSIWHDDGYADYGEMFYQGPGKGVIDKICASHRELLSHSHQVSNLLIELNGESAGSEAYVHGTMRLERDGKLLQMGVWARYIDRWEKRDQCWGLVHRRTVFDHQDIREVNDLPGYGAAATRDKTDPSYTVLPAK